MIDQVEVVYFTGCPNADIVLDTLRANRIPFNAVIQDHLPKDNPKLGLSSPSVLVNGVQVFGNVSTESASSCTFSNLSPETLLQSVRSALKAGSKP